MTHRTVESVLSPLSEKPLQAYLTNTLQVADVVEWCMGQMDGSLTIRQTSFSISEEFIRRLYHLRRFGRIRDIMLLLDHKATNKTLRLWPFLVQTIDNIFLADNHSKLILIESDNLEGKVTKVAIITSQNLTRGNRHESAIITTDAEVYAKLLDEFNDLMTSHSVPLKELFQSKVCPREFI